jgi:hypothetical protein
MDLALIIGSIGSAGVWLPGIIDINIRRAIALLAYFWSVANWHLNKTADTQSAIFIET